MFSRAFLKNIHDFAAPSMASASDDKKLGEKDDAPHPLLPKNHSAELCAFTWKNLKHKHDFESKKLHDQRKELCKLKNDKKQVFFIFCHINIAPIKLKKNQLFL